MSDCYMSGYGSEDFQVNNDNENYGFNVDNEGIDCHNEYNNDENYSDNLGGYSCENGDNNEEFSNFGYDNENQGCEQQHEPEPNDYLYDQYMDPLHSHQQYPSCDQSENPSVIINIDNDQLIDIDNNNYGWSVSVDSENKQEKPKLSHALSNVSLTGLDEYSMNTKPNTGTKPKKKQGKMNFGENVESNEDVKAASNDNVKAASNDNVKVGSNDNDNKKPKKGFNKKQTYQKKKQWKDSLDNVTKLEEIQETDESKDDSEPNEKPLDAKCYREKINCNLSKDDDDEDNDNDEKDEADGGNDSNDNNCSNKWNNKDKKDQANFSGDNSNWKKNNNRKNNYNSDQKNNSNFNNQRPNSNFQKNNYNGNQKKNNYNNNNNQGNNSNNNGQNNNNFNGSNNNGGANKKNNGNNSGSYAGNAKNINNSFSPTAVLFSTSKNDNQFNKNNNNNGNNNNNNSNNNNNGNKHPGFTMGGLVNFDTRKIAGELLRNIVKRQNTFHVIDSWVLKMHYRYITMFFALVFAIVTNSWWHVSRIEVVSGFNANEQVQLRIVNICLSYVYSVDEDGNITFIAFYRWTHWIFLLLVVIFYLPRLIMKEFDVNKLRKLICDLSASNEYDYSDFSWPNDKNKIIKYLLRYKGTHDKVYMLLVFFHLLTFFNDVFIFLSLDNLLNGNFFYLFINFMTVKRDFLNHSDIISRSFPPFTNCTIGASKLINHGRTEEYAVHLPLMELYEKIFCITWFILALMIIITFFSTVFLIFIMVFPVKLIFISTSRSSKEWKTLFKITKLYSFGDLYVLYCIRLYIGDANFSELLSELLAAVYKKKDKPLAKFGDSCHEIV